MTEITVYELLDSLLCPGIAKVQYRIGGLLPKILPVLRRWVVIWLKGTLSVCLRSFHMGLLMCKPLGWVALGAGNLDREKLGNKTILRSAHILSPSGCVEASSASSWSSMELSGRLPRVESGSGTALQWALNQRSHREGAFPCLFTGIYLELGFEREMLSRSLAVSCASPSPNPSSFPCAIWKQYWSWILVKLEIIN